MKPSKYTFFTSLLCASGLSAGLCFCVMTSFAVPADGLSLVCACVLAALLFALFFFDLALFFFDSALCALFSC